MFFLFLTLSVLLDIEIITSSSFLILHSAHTHPNGMIYGSLLLSHNHSSRRFTTSTATTTSAITLLFSVVLFSARAAQSFVLVNVKQQPFVRSTFTSSSFLAMSSSSENQKRVLVPIANGSEEIETTCITDTLVRFGAHVTIASVGDDNNLTCKMSRGINVVADTTIAKAAQEQWDLIVLPGGMPGELSALY
jgi:hypothetical protein